MATKSRVAPKSVGDCSPFWSALSQIAGQGECAQIGGTCLIHGQKGAPRPPRPANVIDFHDALERLIAKKKGSA